MVHDLNAVYSTNLQRTGGATLLLLLLLAQVCLVRLVERLGDDEREDQRGVAAHLDGLGVNADLAPGDRLVRTRSGVTSIELLYKWIR